VGGLNEVEKEAVSGWCKVVASSTWCRCHAQFGLSSALMGVMTPITLSSTLVFPPCMCVCYIHACVCVCVGVRGMATRWRSALPSAFSCVLACFCC